MVSFYVSLLITLHSHKIFVIMFNGTLANHAPNAGLDAEEKKAVFLNIKAPCSGALIRLLFQYHATSPSITYDQSFCTRCRVQISMR